MSNKKSFLVIFFFTLMAVGFVQGQVGAQSLLGLPRATTAEMNAVVGPQVGAVLYNTDESKIYRYTATGWKAATDDQKVDEFLLTGTDLTLSVEDDGEAVKTVDLSGFATDAEVATSITASEALDLDKVIGNESVTGLTFDGTTLTLAQDGAGPETVDLSAVSTDDQKVDEFLLTGTDLTLSVEDDGEAVKTVDLSGFATDTEVATSITASEALDLDKVIGNESVTGLTFDGTTLTLAQDGAGPETVNLASIKDHDWYEVGTATAPNDISDNIFTQGNVGIGTETLTSKLTIAGANNGALSLSGTLPSILFNDTNGGFNVFAFQNAGVNKTAMGRRNDDAFYITMNNGSWNDDSFVILNSNQNVGLGVNIPTAKLDINGDVRVRSLAVGANTNSIVTANADGVLEVVGSADSFATDVELASSDAADLDKVIGNESVTGLAFDGTTLTLTQDGAADETVDLSSVSADNIYTDDGTLTGNRTVTQNNFDLNFNSNTLVVSGDNDRVGIGTNSPNYILHIKPTGEARSLGAFFNDQTTYNAASSNSHDKIVTGMEYNWYADTWRAGATRGGGTDIGSFLFTRNSEEVFGLDANGKAKLHKYGDNSITGTATTIMGVEADGGLVEVNSLKASKVFYPPSIAIDASVTGTFTVDLYAQYIAQFGSPVVSSGGTIPTYNANELDYHVTFADPTVFNTATMAISAAGVLTYTVDAPPADYNSLINVVFVVK